MIINLRQYGLIYLLIFFVIILILVTIAFSIFWVKSAFDTLQIIAGLVSGLIALIIPFQMNKIKKQEKKIEKRQILERIIQIINEFVRYNKNTNKNQSSIFSGIDYIKHNNKLLHHINISLRANNTEGIRGINPPIPPREIYDIIINDKLTIRVTIIATLKGQNFYEIEKIDFYDYNENKIIKNHEDAIKILNSISFEDFLNKI